ncbi:MAG TPA: hypothetical protein ENI20_13130 [Bacteroides sp.]|nr:hypothetical protein [Bacteroides sp.]
MPDYDSFIESCFPHISSYNIKSPIDYKYNCIAFAANDTTKWWWPKAPYYWPPDVPEKEDLASFIACYESLGYVVCGLNSKYKKCYEKVALFVDSYGNPTHAAKQDAENKGIWKSKLGKYKDIEHTLKDISGTYNQYSYGNVAIILKRKVKRVFKINRPSFLKNWKQSFPKKKGNLLRMVISINNGIHNQVRLPAGIVS